MLDNKILIKTLTVTMISISVITAASATDTPGSAEWWAIESNFASTSKPVAPAPAQPVASEPAPQAEGCLR